jgi:hypothetical protein
MKGKELDARLVVHHTIFLPHNPSKDRQTGHWRSERNGPGMNWFFLYMVCFLNLEEQTQRRNGSN